VGSDAGVTPTLMAWRWTVTGIQEAHGTVERPFEDSGVIRAESLGDAVLDLCHRGPFWGLVDEGQRVTLAFEAVRGEAPAP
jgi:hypothetical protein